MSLQALASAIRTLSCGSVLVSAPSSRSESSVCRIAGGRRVLLSKPYNLGPSDVTCYKCLGRSARIRQRRLRGYQSTALKAVAADSKPNDGDGAGASDRAMHMSLACSSQEELKPFFASFVHGLRERLRDLRERGLLQGSNEGFRHAYSRLKNTDGKVALEDISQSIIVRKGVRLWQSLEPWIKWPLAIFAAVYLIMLVTWGMQVVQELTPLWVIGTLVTGLTIRSAYSVGDLAQRSFAGSQPLRRAATGFTLQVYEDAKKGELVDKVRAVTVIKTRELKEQAVQKRLDLTQYVRSGDAVGDFRVFLLQKLTEFNEWGTETYEDVAEWARPSWRAFSRLMRKLF